MRAKTETVWTNLASIRLYFVPLIFLLCANSYGAERPNIVIFLADDSGWGDYSANGNSNLRSPNIDSIARTGAILDRFYVCAVCAPTRAEFLTGRYHLRSGVRGVSTGLERLNLDEKTIADALKAAGYATGAFGKWHNDSQWPYHPNARPPAESQMKEFRPLQLGTMRLEKGRGLLTLQALEIPGASVMEVRQVTLTLKK